MRALLLASLWVPLTAGAALGQAAADPVDVRVRGLFGGELLRPNSYAEVLVTLVNSTDRALSGDLLLEVRDWERPTDAHRVHIDLPARAERRVQVPVYVRDQAPQIRATYAGARLFGRGRLDVPYSSAGEGIAVLADPPRLRGAILSLTYEEVDGWGAQQTVTAPVGVVEVDPDEGDFLAPTTVAGWVAARLVVASAPDLERLTPPQLAALRDWLRTGGKLLVFPRTPEDVRGPALSSLIDPPQWIDGVDLQGHAQTVPPEARGRGFALPEGSAGRLEAFGASFPFGFGRVFLASYEGTAPPYVEAPETRRVVETVLRARGTEPLFAFGGADDSTDSWFGGATFQWLRRALDPNEAFRLGIVFVAAVLLLYVLFVGPLNFRFVLRKNRPLLALATTPALAVVCLLVLLLTGYVAKGVTMRYRAASLLEVTEGDGDGPERRYLGLFFARPATLDLPVAPRSLTRVLLVADSARPTALHRGDETVLTGLRGGLWETLFVRQEAIGSLGAGGVTFERRGRHLVRVRNDSAKPLLGAIVVDSSGGVYRVGDVPPGQAEDIPGAPAFVLSRDGHDFVGVGDPELRSVGEALGLAPSALPAFYGLLTATGREMSSDRPVLWARLPSSDEEFAGRFTAESDLRTVRVVPRLDPAPPPPTAPEAR